MEDICNAYTHLVIMHRIYSELWKIQKKTTENPINWETSWTSIHKRDNHIAKKQYKMCLISLVVR